MPASQAETLADPATIIASRHVPDGTLPMFGTSGYAMSGWLFAHRMLWNMSVNCKALT